MILVARDGSPSGRPHWLMLSSSAMERNRLPAHGLASRFSIARVCSVSSCRNPCSISLRDNASRVCTGTGSQSYDDQVTPVPWSSACLLYTSDAADDLLCVDL